MRKSLILLVVASLVLASCGWRDSRVNPRNWFGRSKEVAAAPAPEQVNPLIPKSRGVFSKPIRPDTSVPVARVTELRVEQTNSGAIIYASGIAARQGAYGARLLPANEDLIPDEKGVLTFSFRVVYPRQPTAVGTELTRTVHDAFSISRQDLAAVRAVRVVAEQNAQESRRR